MWDFIAKSMDFKRLERRSPLLLILITLSSVTSSTSFMMSSEASSVASSSPVSWSSTLPQVTEVAEKPDLPCNLGCCQEANFRPGPLNLTPPAGGFDSKVEDEKTVIYHCVRYFTHFRWYRLRGHSDPPVNLSDIVDDDTRLQPYPWGEGGRVEYLTGRADNQTVVIPRVRREDEGVYAFVASNGTHRVLGTFRLQVNCREVNPRFAIDQQPVQRVTRGSSHTLQCAVSRPRCQGTIFQTNVFWTWRRLSTGQQSMLMNNTLDSVSVVCDRGPYLGGKCDVVISRVKEELFLGEFICRMNNGNDLNQTVQLMPIRNEVRSWLPYVLGITGGAVLLTAVTAVACWRYFHRIAFYCRSLPNRGQYQADAVILHGEDHEQLVRKKLLPGVKALGYDILQEVTTPGRLELTDQLEAVEKCHSVLLTFSSREMAEEGRIDFLTKYIFHTKTPATVLFIRCQDNVAASGATRRAREGEDREQREAEEDTVTEENVEEGLMGVQNPWKNRALQSFTVLTLPDSLHLAGDGRPQGVRKGRREEKFWYSVKKHLPKLPPAVRTPHLQGGRGHHHSTASASQPLMGNGRADRSSTRLSGDGSSPPTHGTAAETGTGEVAAAKPVFCPSHRHPRPAGPVQGSNPQSSVAAAYDTIDHQVDVEISADNPCSSTAPVLIPAGPSANHQPLHPSL